MPASIGVNLRVTGHCSQGGRKYMEDLFSVAYQQTEDERDLEYAFFGIYDGHGGSEAAAFAKEHLMESIVKQRQFWSDNDEDVLHAIRNGYMQTHLNMWKEIEKWPKTVTGLPSTAGTTASVAFIRRGKIYIGHVGDSAIVLGYQKEDSEEWSAKPLTLDHKPESTAEIDRIQRCGGKVISKAGVPRVVWNRPRLGHKGPIKKNTPMDEIPFLAVARSLGDLWSYNPRNDEFIVSPDPDVGVLTIDPAKFRCLIFGTDGLWNMISPEGAVTLVQATEGHNEAALVSGNGSQPRDWLNPSKSLVDHALERWSNTRMRADNTSVVTLMLDPPGPPRATVLRSRTAEGKPCPALPLPPAAPADTDAKPVPQRGLAIMTRFTDPERAIIPDAPVATPAPAALPLPTATDEADDSDAMTNYGNPAESYFMERLLNRTRLVNTLAAVLEELATEARDPKPLPQLRESLPATLIPEPAARPPSPPSPPPALVSAAGDAPAPEPAPPDDGGIQINEVSSSSPTEAPPKTRGRRTRPDAAARPDRVLRSHHEPEPPRPQTRQATDRQARAKPPPPDRVVILTRRPTPPGPAAPPPAKERAPTATVKLERIVVKTERAASETRPRKEEESKGRATRSQAAPALAPATPLAQKITRSIGAYARELRGAAAAGARSGNEPRAGRPARRAPRSKENRAAPAASHSPSPPHPHPHPHPPARHPHPRGVGAGAARRPDERVHSTTTEACAPSPEPEPEVKPRALRSRNDTGRCDAEASTPPCKRTRCDDAAPAAGKTARPAGGGERCARPLGKRASGPWAPALALRNRLRRRLAK